MRNRIAVFGLIIILAAIIFSVKIIKKINHKKQVIQQLATMPKLPGLQLGLNKSSGWQHSYKPTLVLFYNSECGHCKYEATAIQKRLKDFNMVNLLFVSEEKADKIEAFSKTYKLNNKPNIWWLSMQPEDVYSTFGQIGVPHIWIYDEDGKLVKEFKGETKVEAILEWL